MRRVVVWVTLSALLGLPACTTPPSGSEVSLDTPFEIAVGETKSIPAEKLKLELSRVIADSRCPEGATCVRAGEAILGLHLTVRGKKTPELVLGVPPDSAPGEQTAEGFRIKAEGLTPTHKVGDTAPIQGYRATLRIHKAGG